MALALLAVAGVIVYPRLPWSAHAQPASVAPLPAPTLPTEAEQRAQRLRAGVADVERMLGGAFDFAQLPALQERLGRLRADGGGAIADTLATRAKGLLVKSAEAELDRGEIDGGVAHYRVALALDAHAGGEAELAAALRTRAQSALTANKDTEAVRWARQAVALAAADPEAHALLADCLHALREDGEAVTEYEKALSARPDDRTFTHGLASARHALAAETAAARHEQTSHTRTRGTRSPRRLRPRRAPSEGVETSAARLPRGTSRRMSTKNRPRDDKPAPSPPAETAPDQQQ